MSTINMVKTIKKIYPSCVVLVKVGNFYHVYSKDAYILAYLFGYKLTEKEGVPSCGFPRNAVSKVESTLEKNKINYIAVDRRNNYDEEEKNINKQENNYEKIFNKADILMTKIIKIQEINTILLKRVEEENIDKILIDVERIVK